MHRIITVSKKFYKAYNLALAYSWDGTAREARERWGNDAYILRVLYCGGRYYSLYLVDKYTYDMAEEIDNFKKAVRSNNRQVRR